jgi:prenylcysteine oxidase/farnesylcysteine lyase
VTGLAPVDPLAGSPRGGRSRLLVARASEARVLWPIASPPVRVAVIGAGISGAAAARGLRERFGADCELTVLERDARVGGRIRDEEIAGVRVETGATLYHSSNRLVSGFVAELGLSAIDVSAQRQSVGIWDGRAFVLRTRGSGLGDVARMLLRYRIALTRTARLVKGMIERLERVYPQVTDGRAWSGPAELFADLGLRGACDARADTWLQHRGGSERFMTEFADAVSRNNYGQEASGLNAFVDLVSLAGAGLGGGRLYRVKEGNASVVEGLLDRSGAEIRLEAAVERLAPRGPGWSVELAGGDTIDADAVVLAAPLELAAIASELTVPERAYKVIHATFVAGRLEPGFFGDEPAPDFVLTTRGSGPILSAQEIFPKTAGTGALYKVFSLEPLGDGALGRMFDPVEHVRRVTWRAYPELPPRASCAAFRLAPGLYYPSAMEYLVSTMETQALAGTAAANLVAAESRPA